MDNKSSVVFVMGFVLVVLAMGNGLGWQHVIRDFATAPANHDDANGRIKELAPYGAALAGVGVATFASTLAEPVADFFIGTEALIFLALAVRGYKSGKGWELVNQVGEK